MESRRIQDYLDGLFYFFSFIYRSEMLIGDCTNQGIVESFEKFAPIVFGRIVHLRDILNSMAFSLRDIPEFHIKKGILCIEGESEEAFINKMRESHFINLLDIIVEVYGGNKKGTAKKAQLLYDKYYKQGYTVFLQGDADGKSYDIFKGFVEKCHIPKEHTFVFSHNLETAIPPKILFFALQKMGKLQGESQENFIQIVSSNKGSVIPLISEKYNIDLKPLKIELAIAVGDILIQDQRHQWRSNEKFRETELGKFLDFVCNIIHLV